MKISLPPSNGNRTRLSATKISARLLFKEWPALENIHSPAPHSLPALYLQRQHLIKDILIISPNKVFSDYISNVLPELGEETVPETSMEQILSGVLEHKYKYQTYFGLVNELLEKPSSSLIDRIAYKASFGFISELDKFILHIENTYFKAADVKLTKYITIPAPFIEEQYLRFNRYPIRRRFDAMADYMLDMLKIQYTFTVTTTGRNLLKKEIRLMFAGNNDIQVYKDFFKWTNNPGMFKMRKGHTLEYSDLAPLAYLHLALEGNGNQPFRVKHLLIDEMQDYSPIQYKVIQKLFPCRKTVLGDAGQSVNPYGSSTAETIQKSLTASEIMKLCKSYRSTFEITDFAQRFILTQSWNRLPGMEKSHKSCSSAVP